METIPRALNKNGKKGGKNGKGKCDQKGLGKGLGVTKPNADLLPQEGPHGRHGRSRRGTQAVGGGPSQLGMSSMVGAPQQQQAASGTLQARIIYAFKGHTQRPDSDFELGTRSRNYFNGS